MGFFRLIVRALFFSQPAKRHRVTLERLLPSDREGQPAGPKVISTGSNEVRTLSQSVSTDTHRVTIKGRCFVVDGDTIAIGDAQIRLAGIDAPELDHPYGNKAKWALFNLCKGQTIRAVLEGAMSYDRTVATCYLPDGRDLSAEMVKLGLAIDWPKFSGGKYRQYEVANIRRKLWRCEARQKGQMPPSR